MFGFIEKAINPIAEVAKEWIETDKESAEAKAVMVKALDPNGNMRVQISKDVTQMYKVYIYLTMGLVLAQALGIDVKDAIKSLVDLFLPITAMFSGIVGASFGINGLNTHKGK